MSTINPRERYLEILGKDYGFKKEELINDSYGIMIDIGLREGVSSIFISPQGYGNIITKTGGEMLRPYINEETKNAGYKLYNEVSLLKDYFLPPSDLAPPTDGKIFFYIKTEASILKYEEIQDNLTNGKSIFSTAFNTMNDYITLVREAFDAPIYNLKLYLRINNISNEPKKITYGVIVKIDESMGMFGIYPRNVEGGIPDFNNINLSKGTHSLKIIIRHVSDSVAEFKFHIDKDKFALIDFNDPTSSKNQNPDELFDFKIEDSDFNFLK